MRQCVRCLHLHQPLVEIQIKSMEALIAWESCFSESQAAVGCVAVLQCSCVWMLPAGPLNGWLVACASFSLCCKLAAGTVEELIMVNEKNGPVNWYAGVPLVMHPLSCAAQPSIHAV